MSRWDYTECEAGGCIYKAEVVTPAGRLCKACAQALVAEEYPEYDRGN